MPKFLALASYTSEGIKGFSNVRGTARRAVADKLLKSLGGRLEAFYFAFGENDAYLIFDVPDNSTAAAISLAVTGTGVIRMKTVALLTPEEMDQVTKKPVHYEHSVRELVAPRAGQPTATSLSSAVRSSLIFGQPPEVGDTGPR